MERANPQQSLKAYIRKSVPDSLTRPVQAILNVSRADRRECNICGHEGKFWPFGNPPRRGAICAKCGAMERHRLMALWMDGNASTIDGVRILHFAPEIAVTRMLRGRSNYRSADLKPGAADSVLNIEKIDLPSESIDVVVCSHVLEHVDDKAALAEIHRVLAPGGKALLMFPVVEGWENTYENSLHTSPADREMYFGQSDHVRMFGRDVRDRIENAGFSLTEFTAEEPSVSRYGLIRGEKLFIAAKPG
jgi:SAM-dependent methyltransferase